MTAYSSARTLFGTWSEKTQFRAPPSRNRFDLMDVRDGLWMAPREGLRMAPKEGLWMAPREGLWMAPREGLWMAPREHCADRGD